MFDYVDFESIAGYGDLILQSQHLGIFRRGIAKSAG